MIAHFLFKAVALDEAACFRIQDDVQDYNTIRFSKFYGSKSEILCKDGREVRSNGSIIYYHVGMHRAREARARRFSGSVILGLGHSRARLFSGSAILGLGHSRARLFSGSVILGLGHSRAGLFPMSKIVETVIDIDFRHRE